MPEILQEDVRQYQITCKNCDSLIGFTSDEVEYSEDYDDARISCPKCHFPIHIKSNYKKTLKSTKV